MNISYAAAFCVLSLVVHVPGAIAVPLPPPTPLQTLMGCYEKLWGGAFGGSPQRLHEDPKEPAVVLFERDNEQTVSALVVYTRYRVFRYPIEPVSGELDFLGYRRRDLKLSVPPRPIRGIKTVEYTLSISEDTRHPETTPTVMPGGAYDAREKNTFVAVDGEEARETRGAPVLDPLREAMAGEVRRRVKAASTPEEPGEEPTFSSVRFCNEDCRWRVAFAKRHELANIEACLALTRRADEPELAREMKSAADALRRLSAPPSLFARDSRKSPLDDDHASAPDAERVRPFEAALVQELTPKEVRRIDGLVSRLADGKSAVKASTELVELGAKAGPALRAAMLSPDATLRKNADRTLTEIRETDPAYAQLDPPRPGRLGFGRARNAPRTVVTDHPRTDPWRRQLVRLKLGEGKLSAPVGRDWFQGEGLVTAGGKLRLDPDAGSREDREQLRLAGVAPGREYTIGDVVEEEYSVRELAPPARRRGFGLQPLFPRLP